MIMYENAKLHPLRLFQMYGSVMPFCFIIALPCGLVTAGLKLIVPFLDTNGGIGRLISLGESNDAILGAAFSGVNFLIGFLVVFRSSQAYNRFWEGLSAIHAMQGGWWDAASSLCAFCKCASAPYEDVILFQHTLVRLISLLNGCVLMELSSGFNSEDSDHGSQSAETCRKELSGQKRCPSRTQRLDQQPREPKKSKRAFELELLDAEGIDSESLYFLNTQPEKVELLFQWIQQLIVESAQKDVFSVSGPILSRAFQELSAGMVEYRHASKIAQTPLPFPYMQATELLLVSHWLCTPVLMCVWVDSPLWAGLLSFIQVLFYWALNSIATELENPFGEDANDLPAKEIQQAFNRRLLLLIRPATLRTARLSKKAAFEETRDGDTLKFGKMQSLSGKGVYHDQSILSMQHRDLEDNRITWGNLQNSIYNRVSQGYVSTDSESGYAYFASGEKLQLSARSNNPDSSRRRGSQRVEEGYLMGEENSLKDLKEASFRERPSVRSVAAMSMPGDRGNDKSKSAVLDIDKEGEDPPPVKHFWESDHIHASRCLASLPELLLVMTDLRDHMKVVMAPPKPQAPPNNAGSRFRDLVESARGVYGGRHDVVPEEPQAIEGAGKSLGSEGCLVLGGCSSFSTPGVEAKIRRNVWLPMGKAPRKRGADVPPTPEASANTSLFVFDSARAGSTPG